MPVSPESDSAFSLVHATRAFGATPSVDDVSIDFARGRTSILIGSSGSGKSTVLRLLLGLEWPDAGRILCDSEALRRETLPEVRRRVNYVIQEGGLFPHLSVRRNLLYGRWFARGSGGATADLGAVVELLGIESPGLTASLAIGEQVAAALGDALH